MTKRTHERIAAAGGQAAGGRLRRLALCAAALVAVSIEAGAQQVQRIAAIVNDQVISSYDLDQRVQLVVATSGIPRTPENIERIEKQILRSLIDEQLQLQEAKKNDIKVNNDEVDKEIERIAKQSNVTTDQIVKQLRSQGVSIDTLRSQIMSEIAWSKLVQRRFGPRVSISEEEINQVIERMQANADKPQYRVSEIFLPVESPDQAEAVQQNAMRLLEQIRQGAPFPQIARAFSQSPSASRGGDIGWVQDGQLPPELNQVVSKLKPGRISLPIPTSSGFYILAMSDRRLSPMGTPADAELSLYEVALKAPPASAPKAKQEEVLRMAYGISQALPGCAAARQLVAENEQVEGRDLGTLKLSGITNKVLKEQLATLTAGDATDPTRSDDGYLIFFVCERKAIGDTGIPRDAVENQLFNQQLSMLARRYLRDLRRDATVEMR